MPSKDNIKSSVQETSPEDVIGTNMWDLFSRGNEAEAARYTLRRLTSSVDTMGGIDHISRGLRCLLNFFQRNLANVPILTTTANMDKSLLKASRTPYSLVISLDPRTVKPLTGMYTYSQHLSLI